MNKKEIAEIKKQFTATNCCVTRVATCYVTHEKEIALQKVTPFLSLPEEEAFKYFDIFRKSLSGKKGKNLYDIPMQTEDGGSEEENFLNDLRKSQLKDESLLENFYARIIDSYISYENFLIILVHGVYDIPGKVSDGTTMYDASDDVYEHLLCCICPVSLSKPGLFVNLPENTIEDRIRDWVVDVPVDGFLYPAFNDRQEDIHELLYYSKKAPIAQHDFVHTLTGREEALLSDEEEKELIAGILDETSHLSYNVMRDFTDAALEKITEADNEEVRLSVKELGNMLEQNGMTAEEKDNFMAACKTRLGEDREIKLNSLVDLKKTTVKTMDTTIKVDAERTFDIQTKEVDGRVYLMIPLNENLVEVNGVPVKGIDK